MYLVRYWQAKRSKWISSMFATKCNISLLTAKIVLQWNLQWIKTNSESALSFMHPFINHAKVCSILHFEIKWPLILFTLQSSVALISKRYSILRKILVLFPLPKNVLCSILSFVFWIFPPLDTVVQLESVDSKQTQFQNLFFRIDFGTFLGQWEKCVILSKKKRPLDTKA